jgi:hypothetical protein
MRIIKLQIDITKDMIDLTQISNRVKLFSHFKSQTTIVVLIQVCVVIHRKIIIKIKIKVAKIIKITTVAIRGMEMEEATGRIAEVAVGDIMVEGTIIMGVAVDGRIAVDLKRVTTVEVEDSIMGEVAATIMEAVATIMEVSAVDSTINLVGIIARGMADMVVAGDIIIIIVVTMAGVVQDIQAAKDFIKMADND